jgi:hypothetical protein
MIAIGLSVKTSTAKFHNRVFEDNTGALEIAKTVARCRLRTKQLNIRLDHLLLRSYVDDGQIRIHKIDTLKQPGDLLTKPLNAEKFKKFRRETMGW